MVTYENILRKFYQETKHALNEWQSKYQHSAKKEYYNDRMYFPKNEVCNMLKYLIQRWNDTLKWCQEHNQENNAYNIFYKNMFSDKREVFEHVKKIMGLDDNTWKYLLTLDTPEKQQEYFNQYYQTFKNNIDNEIAEREEKNRIQQEEYQSQYDAWLENNHWFESRDDMSFVDYTTRINAMRKELYVAPLNKNPLLKKALDTLYDERNIMLEGVQRINQGSMNGWNEKSREEQAKFFKGLKERGITRQATFEEEIGRCWNEYTDVYCDETGMPRYLVIYDVDSSD